MYLKVVLVDRENKLFVYYLKSFCFWVPAKIMIIFNSSSIRWILMRILYPEMCQQASQVSNRSYLVKVTGEQWHMPVD